MALGNLSLRGELLLLVLVLCARQEIGQAAENEDEKPPEADEEEQDQSGDCWTYGGHRQQALISESDCCRNSPCGGRGCWRPPEFTFSFCCRENACRPLVVGDIQRVIFETSKLPLTMNSTLVSRRAYRTVGEHLRQLLNRFRGTFLRRMWHEVYALDCDCAVAVAAAALLEPGGLASDLVHDTIQPAWFADEIDWVTLLINGWSPMFAILARASRDPAMSHGVTVHPAVEAMARDSFRTHKAELERTEDLVEFLRGAQRVVRPVGYKAYDNQVGFRSFVIALAQTGLWDLIWTRVEADLVVRRMGRRCSTGFGKDAPPPRTEAALTDPSKMPSTLRFCEPWEYAPAANFSSPRPNIRPPPGGSLPVAAACVLGAPRTVVETYSSIFTMVVEELRADVFAYVPFSRLLTHELEANFKNLGPVVTALLAPDVDADGMRARFYRELSDPKLDDAYKWIGGPFRSPLHGQMGTVMWSYFAQSVCRRMVYAHEKQRAGRRYEWVIFARADMLWGRSHPPVSVLDPGYVHVPYGQDNSFYNHGSENGLNDRHAAIPREFTDAYLSRWEALTGGASWNYLQRAAYKGELINAEQFNLMHLRAEGVPVRRFPPVSYLANCIESPQCLHLYRGTNLGNRKWTFSAKYFTELVEVVRTSYDPLRRAPRLQGVWAPHVYTLDPDTYQPWEVHSLDWACGLGPSGPISSRRWDLMSQCRCFS
eukprot:TRINITY_DN46215_c0_g1_i1.p1 TRINITY_DN46215_c0_g1~~TRINITY_DN46215_c0_g1_i1.p1  ORF type:complete len:711 (-),score=95.94 TRINITY_DN46215_c0_g1_i1:102-2234(-)